MRNNPYPGIDCTPNFGSQLHTQICLLGTVFHGSFSPSDPTDHSASNRITTHNLLNVCAGHIISVASAEITLVLPTLLWPQQRPPPSITMWKHLRKRQLKQMEKNIQDTGMKQNIVNSRYIDPWVKVQNFQNPELLKFKF